MEQLVEPKQDINKGVKLVYWWVESMLQKELEKEKSTSHPAAHAVPPVGAAALSGATEGKGDRNCDQEQSAWIHTILCNEL